MHHCGKRKREREGGFFFDDEVEEESCEEKNRSGKKEEKTLHFCFPLLLPSSPSSICPSRLSRPWPRSRRLRELWPCCSRPPRPSREGSQEEPGGKRTQVRRRERERERAAIDLANFDLSISSTPPLSFTFRAFDPPSECTIVISRPCSTISQNSKLLSKTEDHERAARAFASAASALDSLLASSSKSHGEDRLAALRSEELALREELEAKCELVQGVAAKIDGWRLRAKEALSKAEGVASAAAAKTSSCGGNEQQQLP